MTLLSLPLELRHRIYGFSSQLDGPEFVLKNWFDKTDPATANTPAVGDGGGDGGVGGDEDDEEDDEYGDGDVDLDEDGDADGGDDGDDGDGGDGITNNTSGGGTATTTASTGTTTQTTIHTTRRTKYRHTIGIIGLTACPPPVCLLLTDRQLRIEAIDYYYNTTVLKIHATKSFAHTSFFEHILSMLESSTSSPVAQIRKVELTFSWDSAWIHANGADISVELFESLLQLRAKAVIEMLRAAPKLRELKVKWYDSEASGEASELQQRVLEGLYELVMRAEVEVEAHFAEGGAMLRETRREFQKILNGVQQIC